MKKLIITAIVAVGFAAGAFAQGYIAWNSTPGANLIAWTNTTTYSSLSPTLGGGASTGGGAAGNTVGGGSSTFYFALMVNTSGSLQSAPTTLAGLSSWSYTGLIMTNGSAANGRLTPANTQGAGAVAYPANSGAENFMLVGWSANFGTTNATTVISDLNNWSTFGSTVTGPAFFGMSSVGLVTPTTSPVSGATAFGSTGGLIFNPSTAPMVLYVLSVPEPGTMALAAIGGASLLLFRRRK